MLKPPTRPRPTATRVSRVLLAVLVGCTLAACSSHSADPTVEAGQPAGTVAASTSVVAPDTSAVPPPAPTTTPTSSAAAPGSTDPGAVTDLVTAVYWTRPYNGTRPVSLVGYDDPTTGPRPFVLYGSITNNGPTTVANPFVTLTGTDPTTGALIVFGEGRVLDPRGADLASLEPGASADVLVVVTDPTLGARLSAIEPVLAGGGR